MFCDVKTCPVAFAHSHCAYCNALMLAEGGGGDDGREIACYADDDGANAQSCMSCDSMLCGACQKRANGICMLCMAEIAAANHRAVDAMKVYCAAFTARKEYLAFLAENGR